MLQVFWAQKIYCTWTNTTQKPFSSYKKVDLGNLFVGQYADASRMFDAKIDYIGTKSKASIYNFREYESAEGANFVLFLFCKNKD